MSKLAPHADHWALQYINVAHLNAILEAIDDDGTRFISIKEANTFANERPQGWRCGRASTPLKLHSACLLSDQSVELDRILGQR
jgi:hypothetical protein